MEDFNSSLFWFIAGLIGGFITNLVSPPIYSWLRRQLKGWLVRQSTNRHATIIIGVSTLKEKLRVGTFSVNWILLQYAHYVQGRIQTSYDNTRFPLLPEFARMRTERLRDQKNRLAAGESNIPHNGPMYKLTSFDVGHREIIDGEEIPVLRLAFCPTDYYTQMVTDLNIGEPLRERLAKAIDITQRPVPEFASIVGVNINIITSDGYIIVTERSRTAHVAGGRLHTSVAENILRPTDAGTNNAPDLFRCALRGTQEELGLTLEVSDIEFTSFGVEPNLCQYSLIGWSRVKETREEVELIRSQALPKDKWESRRLIFVPCNPRSIAEIVIGSGDQWFPTGQAAVVLALSQVGFSQKDINAAFTQGKDR